MTCLFFPELVNEVELTEAEKATIGMVGCVVSVGNLRWSSLLIILTMIPTQAYVKSLSLELILKIFDINENFNTPI